jgi:hypothetical protein
MSPSKRIYHLQGTPFEIGYAMGQALGMRLEANIELYIQERLLPGVEIDEELLRTGSLTWLDSLPPRFREEFEGLAQGSGLPLQRLAEWAYREVLLESQCSGVICLLDGHAWVARNNDFFKSELWGYVTIREVSGRIPAISFGLEGDVFTPTGVNQEQVWLHYNYLPAPDSPTPNKPHLPAYAFMVEALETCRSLQDVERLLESLPRDGGMLLFAVDGKSEQFALYECSCTDFTKLQARDGWLVGTNHYCAMPFSPPPPISEPLSTFSRYERLEELVRVLYLSTPQTPIHARLIQMLADEGVESRSGDIQTVYSNVACPGTREMWYTFGGCPSASQGDWQRLEWPW